MFIERATYKRLLPGPKSFPSPSGVETLHTDPCEKFSTRSGGMTLAWRFNAAKRRMIVRVASRFQPERLADSSRWSQRSADHRKAASVCPHSEGVQEPLRPLQGLKSFASPSGGLRCATTTGYYLTALQAEACEGRRGCRRVLRTRL